MTLEVQNISLRTRAELIRADITLQLWSRVTDALSGTPAEAWALAKWFAAIARLRELQADVTPPRAEA